MKKITLLIMQLFVIISIQAQDYLISFTGSGASTELTEVKVENLMQETSITLKGNQVLHLKSNITGIYDVKYNHINKIRFYPNPMNDYTIMEFEMPEEGETQIELFDFLGREIVQTNKYLVSGQQTFRITGIQKGVYVVHISAGNQLLSGKLLCNGDMAGVPDIVYQHTNPPQIITNTIKSAASEVIMQYNEGDLLKFTATTDSCSTVMVDVPSKSKEITLNLVPCTDADGKNYPVVQIGKQTWMAGNLAYLPKVSSPSDGSIDEEFYYVYGYDGTSVAEAKATTNYTTYGVLYNWLAAIEACPTGWRLPNVSDWEQLAQYISDQKGPYSKNENDWKVVGSHLKATKGWNSNGNGFDDFGFSGLPGGLRDTSGKFNYEGNSADWWSSGEFISDMAWGGGLFHNIDIFRQSAINKEAGLSARYIKEEKKKPRELKAFPGIKGELLDFIIQGDTITVEKINNKYVYQGDIFLTEEQLNADSIKGAGINSIIKKWCCDTLFYKISDDLGLMKGIINSAIQHYKSNTYVEFKKWTDEDNYVEFIKDTFCASYLGMRGGRQEIWIADWADAGVVIHEIGHAIGLIHEHSRVNRDEYVRIIWENIQKGEDHNFTGMWTKYESGDFDFNSIMLYGPFSFSVAPGDSYPTILKRDYTLYEFQEDVLSNDDINVINTIYPKEEECVELTSTVIENKCPAEVETLIEIDASPICDLRYPEDFEVSERGVYWGSEPRPDSTGTKIEAGSGTGAYTVEFKSAVPDSTYYVVAYTITKCPCEDMKCDTVYGNEVSFVAPKSCCATNPFQTGCNGLLWGEGVLEFEYEKGNGDILGYYMHIYVVANLDDGKFFGLPYLDIKATEFLNGSLTYNYIKEKRCEIAGSCTDRWDCFEFSYGQHVFDFCLSNACYPPDCEGYVTVLGKWTIDEKEIKSSAVFPIKYSSSFVPFHY